MKLRLKWNITSKLVLINAVILLVVGGIIFVVNASFQRIQASLTQTIHEDVNQVIQNAHLSRELNKTFTEINTLIRALYDEELQLDKEGQALLQNIQALSQQELDTQMQHSLQEVLEELPRLFTQGTAIREYIEQLQTIDHELVTTLAELEEMLDEQLIILTMEGHDPLSISQMSALIPGYRETLLRIKIHLSAFQQEHFKGEEEDEHTDHQLSSEELHSTMFSLFDDLLLRFRTLLATDPDIAQYGQRLINQVHQYKEHVLIFHDALQKLDLQIFVINGMQEDMLSIMRESDDRIAETTGEIQPRMLRVIGRSKKIITILSGIIVVVLLFGWLVTHWMTRPLLDLSFAAEQLADGNLECYIEDISSRDEIGTLATAFKDLISYFQEMEHTATEISHGNLDLEVHPRSSKDVFGNRFQQMITYLKNIGSVASHVAEGDLRTQVQLQSEEDQLGNAFANMQEGLVHLIEGIRSGADHLSSISTQVLDTSSRNNEALGHIGNAADVTASAMQQMKSSAEEVHLSTEHLRSSVEETSTSITEMISSVKHVAENSRKLSSFADNTVKTVSQIVGSLETVADQAEHSKTLAETTAEDVVSGQHSVEQMISKMNAISGVTENISSIISRFEQRSIEIGTILDVINEVAEQTSLLALNASIIAAQAGAQGRGFAVVADEIKELATRVGTSTNEIGKIIKGVQSDSSEAAIVIEQGHHEVEFGVNIANEAGDALHKIGQSAANSSNVAAEIAVSVRRQTTSSRQVADSMKDVADMIVEITQATEEQENNSSQLLQVVENMQILAEQVLRAMREQQQSTGHVTEFMDDVTVLVSQNRPTVEQLARTAHELAAQAENLKSQVERFVVPDNHSLIHHSSEQLEGYKAKPVQ